MKYIGQFGIILLFSLAGSLGTLTAAVIIITGIFGNAAGPALSAVCH